jgi:hypothetical protein
MQPANPTSTYNGFLNCFQNPAGALQVGFTSCDGATAARLIRGGRDIYTQVCPDDGQPVQFDGWPVYNNGPCIEVAGPITKQPCPGGI